MDHLHENDPSNSDSGNTFGEENQRNSLLGMAYQYYVGNIEILVKVMTESWHHRRHVHSRHSQRQ